jgi:aspartyl-tRNA synthetase
MQALRGPLTVKGYQYDIICNGYELLSGPMRNHSPEISLKAFAIDDYSESDVHIRFQG